MVLWPRARAFAIAAKGSPEWAVSTLRNMVAAGKKGEARAKARELLPFWPATVRAAESTAALVPTLRLVCELGDRELAEALPRPFSRPALGPELATACIEVATKYGRATCIALLEAWAAGRAAEERAEWIGGSRRFCERLAAEDGGPGRAIAAAWIAAQWEWLVGDERTDRDEPAHFRDERLQRRAPAILALLGGAVLVDDATARAIVGWLAEEDEAFPLPGIMAVCRKGFDAKRSSERLRESLRPVLGRCAQELEKRLSAPTRVPGDWSIRWRARCKCDLCAKLAAFLARADARRLDWPLAKDGRQHVHRTIDGHRLPVSHETRRSGSPYTLVLVKTEALIEREAAARTWCARELAWVRERLAEAEPNAKRPRRGRRLR